MLFWTVIPQVYTIGGGRIIIIISIQPEGRLWQEPEPSQATGMALAHCILGSFLGKNYIKQQKSNQIFP